MVVGESGRSKAPKVDGPGLKWTVKNDIKWTVYESGLSTKVDGQKNESGRSTKLDSPKNESDGPQKMKPQKCVGIKKHESGRSQIV